MWLAVRRGTLYCWHRYQSRKRGERIDKIDWRCDASPDVPSEQPIGTSCNAVAAQRDKDRRDQICFSISKTVRIGAQLRKRRSRSCTFSIGNGAPKWIRTTGLCLRRATLYPAELWVHDAGRTWRLAKAMGLRQPQFTRAPSYFAAFSIGWNLPRPQLAPGCRPGPAFHNTVMISTEQSCEMLVW